MPFSKLGLSDQLVQGILATGYSAPTAIQAKAIPAALAGRDLIGSAQTGTGKTAAFMLPIIQRLSGPSAHGKHPRALVLVPTRELAQQVEDFATNYGRFTNLRVTSVFGGVNMNNQMRRLHRGVDVVVATPGRLIDHLNRKTIDLSHVQVLVLDEADRMFDMGFINDVKKIIARVPDKRQTMLFSATMSSEVKALVASVQHDPVLIEIGEQRRPADTVQHHFYKVPREQKLPLLVHILKKKELTSVLVFARTKHGADKISRRLERSGLRSVAIHSNRTQAQRERALAGFRNGQYAVLVATDIAARGIDVEGISHVINFEPPMFAEDYIHRIGRTGRAESRGDAFTFVSSDEVKNFKKIEHYTGKKFTLSEYPEAVVADAPSEVIAEPRQRGHGGRQRQPQMRQERREPGDRKQHPQHGGAPRSHRPERGTGPSHHSGGRAPQGGGRPQHPGNRPKSGGIRPRGGKPMVQPKAKTSASQPADWRKLMTEIEGKEGLGKKLRKLFKRG